MVIKNAKQKGTSWERDATKLLTELIGGSHWKRIAGSGAIGTILNEPLLTGDIAGKLEGVGKSIRAEAKVGYGGSTQMAVKREWLEKIREEAEGSFSIPMLFGKFSGARGGSKHFVVMDFAAFAEVANIIRELAMSEVALMEELDYE